MAIYLKIGSTQYKLPNRIIVGRGEPFTQFNDDRSIGRAHLLLVRKKDGIYVKDLGSPTGTVVNGKKLPKNKLTKWNEALELKVGTFQFSQHAKLVDKECIQVSVIKGYTGGAGNEIVKWLLGLGTIAGLFGIWIGSDSKVHVKVMMSVFIVALMGGMYLFQWLINKIIYPKNMHITDVFLGSDGFTAHYDSGGNMTLKLSAISSWRKQFKGAIVRMDNDEVYNFVQMKNPELLVEYLEKNASKKMEEYNWTKDYGLVALGLVIAGALIHFDVADKLSPTLIVLFLAASVGCAMLFNKKGKGWGVNNRFMNNKKILQSLGGLALVLGALDYMGPTEKELALANQHLCKESQERICKDIEYKHIPKNEIVSEKAKLACDFGNKSACAEITRLPASTTK